MAKWKTTMEAQKERQKSRSTKEKPESDLSDLDYVKTQAQKIIDILSKDQEPPPCKFNLVSKFQQVCEVIQKVLNKERSVKKKEVKNDNERVISEFEGKINEIEREKVFES